MRSQVEPRIVERRRKVVDAERVRRRRRWIAVGVVVAVLAAVVGVFLSPLVDVDSVTVSGSGRLSDAAIIAASGISTGDQLVLVDLEAARDALVAVPGIASARVARVWPDTVEIAVVEERPLAVIDTGSTEFVVSRTGRVLDPSAQDGVALPVLRTEVDPGLVVGEDVPAGIRDAATVYARMSDPLKAELPTAVLSEDDTLSFELPDDGTVRFGPVEDVPAKLVAIQAVLDQVVRTCMTTLDVREATRPTVSRTPGCAVPPPTSTGDPQPSGDEDPAAGSTDGPTPGSTPDSTAGTTADGAG